MILLNHLVLLQYTISPILPNVFTRPRSAMYGIP
ncbi:hypothetical protein AZE42_06882 [Rhizopogon vesiculosus]|uniref:Uncharacterized protein n=1 Tax=Rhizopogon vesiculosus TaxID=180088 RepID=A0A1J8QTD9_9AGAM|nr:hypothetical protein AZE42_06882 [Rhizopogon vesiculosus]